MKVISEDAFTKTVEVEFTVRLIGDETYQIPFTGEISKANSAIYSLEESILRIFLEKLSVQNGFFYKEENALTFFMKSFIVSIEILKE